MKPIGSIISGTTLPRDLIPAFIAAVNEFSKPEEGWEDSEPDYDNDDEVEEVLTELFERLEELAPPYFYFGTRKGDGEDYGFWLREDWNQMAQEDDVPVVADSGQLPEDHVWEWFLLNDHGNLTFYSRDLDGEDKEIWSIV